MWWKLEPVLRTLVAPMKTCNSLLDLSEVCTGDEKLRHQVVEAA
jgi:hypothetical protein